MKQREKNTEKIHIHEFLDNLKQPNIFVIGVPKTSMSWGQKKKS